MAPVSNPRLGSLLRYTYQAHMVFFAGFATWYFLKGSGQKEPARVTADQEKTKRPGTK
jgi:hypothetical protein